MESTELLPYFHPTQLVLVDDDIDFLGNLSLQLDADLAYLLFDSTTKALGYINDLQEKARPRERFFDVIEPGRTANGGTRRPKVRLDTDALVKEMHFSNRFSQISVAMVDYSMPQMDGLQFCERIDNPHIKKILFTGVATEADAVDAFNRGVIDRYIRKSEHQVYEHLNHTIRQLQHEYISDTFAAAGQIFDIDKPVLLGEPQIIALMDKLKTRFGFVEYYLAANPGGFLLVASDGHVRRLALCDEQDMAQQLAQARAYNAPKSCLEALAAGEVILCPTIQPGNAPPQAALYGQWQRYARASARLQGSRTYHWALFDPTAEEATGLAPAATYDSFLEWLDTVGYSLM